ncbi:MAG: hypothetical protein ABTD50_20905 [Polyangiaceae bacterium]|jgi:hypothetical protein
MNHTLRRVRPLFLLSACALGTAIAAYAPAARSETAGDSPPASDSLSAAEHSKRAEVAYNLQDWATAIREYKLAFRVEQRPEYLWGLAQAQRLSGEYATAISTYKAYRRTDVTSNQATAAELQITKCETEILKKQAEAAAAARASEPSSSAPATAQPEHPASQTDSLSTHTVEQRAPSQPFYKDALGDALFVTGVVGASVGAYLLLMGNSDMKDAGTSAVYRDFDSKTESASKEQVAGCVTLGGAGIVLIASVVRYLTLGHSSPEERSALVVAPNGVIWAGTY